MVKEYTSGLLSYTAVYYDTPLGIRHKVATSDPFRYWWDKDANTLPDTIDATTYTLRQSKDLIVIDWGNEYSQKGQLCSFFTSYHSSIFSPYLFYGFLAFLCGAAYFGAIVLLTKITAPKKAVPEEAPEAVSEASPEP